MFVRLGMFFALVLAVGAITLGAGSRAEAAEKVVTINPTSGIVGTQVTAELFNAPPNDPITVIFKIPGDPILATGTTDANGYAKFTFTIPYVPYGGTFPIFFTDFKCSCQVAVDFTVTVGVRTPTPTATPTTPPTATPTRTVAPPTVTPTATATATPTPRVPVAGNATPGAPGGPNAGILGLGFLAIISILAWFAATRRGPNPPAFAVARVDDDPGGDYSTELDPVTLESLRRPFRPALTRSQARRGSAGWAAGAVAAAIAGFVLLRRK